MIMLNRIKLATIVFVALSTLVAAWHMKSIQTKNRMLTTENATLRSTNETNQATIATLKYQSEKNEALVIKWREERENLLRNHERLAAQIRRELSTDENFKTWADNPLPDNVIGLLNNAAHDS
jgi:LysB family phage lysis regulatory protein